MRIAILAGGQSRRFGTDKAEYMHRGETLLTHVVKASLGCGLPVMVVGREAPEDWSTEPVEFIDTESEKRGPLSGLVAAMHYCHDDILLLGCDMPLLETSGIQWLITTAQEKSSSIVPQCAQKHEPLFAVYRHSLLPELESRLQDARLAMHALAKLEEVAVVTVPAWLEPQLANVNTQGDLAQITEKHGE